MTLTIQQVVADAKVLVSKLKESTEKADDLIARSKQLQKEIDDMATYREDSGGEAPPVQPTKLFIPENAQIKALEQENKELRCAIIEQQNGLEMIMSKYRQDITSLVNQTRMNLPKINEGSSHDTMLNQALRINEMAEIMKKASFADEDKVLQNEELLQQLMTENQGLKELVKISAENGSLNVDNIPSYEDHSSELADSQHTNISTIKPKQNTVKRKLSAKTDK
ncbi:FGFR1 oncogene partner 2 homolog [Cimex lectularius]|uniref:FGFR1 oncogene partner 2 homolog n=1 Tax=Cimex lectularius TaxID=79782 RepID=A0A8I6RUH9_CIMLE|nr:FGFR1 oncogene partner 2 homolog [Cimex lectularius]XP_014251092.1 FGFR1 oncogene partner 2 homolog [Cimex lectularius]